MADFRGFRVINKAEPQRPDEHKEEQRKATLKLLCAICYFVVYRVSRFPGETMVNDDKLDELRPEASVLSVSL